MKQLQKTKWNMSCNPKMPYSAMTVRISFSHDENESDEVDFCIEVENKAELNELFDTFCKENKFQNVSVSDICIVKVAASLEGLTALEELEIAMRYKKEPEILYKAKRTDNDVWIEGYYVRLNSNHHRIYTGYAEVDCGDYYPDFYEVDPNTLCQSTGLRDRNLKTIWKNDIVKATFMIAGQDTVCYAIGYVIYEDDGFKIKVTTFHNSRKHKEHTSEEQTTYYIKHNFLDRNYKLEVIGNIFDNPELI